jgi:hypothetical protein
MTTNKTGTLNMIIRTLSISVFTLLLAMTAQAQTSGQQSLASTLQVYVFPSAGQAPEQQSKDEAECYQWAVNTSGSDPFAVQNQQAADAAQTEAAEQQASQVAKGSGTRGMVRGAAGGALIGAIAGDAGKGAAIGAAVGVVGGRARGNAQQAQAEQQVQSQGAQAQQASQAQIDNFRKAFSACLEAKDYIVKY